MNEISGFRIVSREFWRSCRTFSRSDILGRTCRKKKNRLTLYIFIGMGIGLVVGALFPEMGDKLRPLSDHLHPPYQIHHRPSDLRDPRRRHRRPQRPQDRRPDGPQGARLFRGRHDRRPFPRARFRQPRQARRGNDAPGRRHQRHRRQAAEIRRRPGPHLSPELRPGRGRGRYPAGRRLQHHLRHRPDADPCQEEAHSRLSASRSPRQCSSSPGSS